MRPETLLKILSSPLVTHCTVVVGLTLDFAALGGALHVQSGDRDVGTEVGMRRDGDVELKLDRVDGGEDCPRTLPSSPAVPWLAWNCGILGR